MRFGCLFIIIAVVLLCVLVVLPVLPFTADNSTIDTALQPILCQQGETIQRDQYSRNDRQGTSYSMVVYCVSERTKRDVTGQWTLLSIGAFIIPLFIGIGSIIRSANRLSKGFTSGDDASRMPRGTPIFSSGGSLKVGPDKSLADKLRELQDLRDKGLITGEEFDKLRKEILDKGMN